MSAIARYHGIHLNCLPGDARRWPRDWSPRSLARGPARTFYPLQSSLRGLNADLPFGYLNRDSCIWGRSRAPYETAFGSLRLTRIAVAFAALLARTLGEHSSSQCRVEICLFLTSPDLTVGTSFTLGRIARLQRNCISGIRAFAPFCRYSSKQSGTPVEIMRFWRPSSYDICLLRST